MSDTKIFAREHCRRNQPNGRRSCALTSRVQSDHSSIAANTPAGRNVGCALFRPRTNLAWTKLNVARHPTPWAACKRSLNILH